MPSSTPQAWGKPKLHARGMGREVTKRGPLCGHCVLCFQVACIDFASVLLGWGVMTSMSCAALPQSIPAPNRDNVLFPQKFLRR